MLRRGHSLMADPLHILSTSPPCAAPTTAATHGPGFEVSIVVPPALAYTGCTTVVPITTVIIVVFRSIVSVDTPRAPTAAATHTHGFEVTVVMLPAMVSISIIVGVPFSTVTIIVCRSVVGVDTAYIIGELKLWGMTQNPIFGCCNGHQTSFFTRHATGAIKAEGIHTNQLNKCLVVPKLEPWATAVPSTRTCFPRPTTASTNDSRAEVASDTLHGTSRVQLSACVTVMVQAEPREANLVTHSWKNGIQNQMFFVGVLPVERENRNVQAWV